MKWCGVGLISVCRWNECPWSPTRGASIKNIICSVKQIPTAKVRYGWINADSTKLSQTKEQTPGNTQTDDFWPFWFQDFCCSKKSLYVPNCVEDPLARKNGSGCVKSITTRLAGQAARRAKEPHGHERLVVYSAKNTWFATNSNIQTFDVMVLTLFVFSALKKGAH